MDWPERFLRHRVREELAWLRDKVDIAATEEDALAHLRDQCGYTVAGCRYEASEYCEIDCPFKEDGDERIAPSQWHAPLA